MSNRQARSFPATVMLLGSGELGKEVAIAAQRLGCQVIAVDRYAGAPAMQVADVAEVVAFLKAEKPPLTHVCLTGRGASEALIEAADLVTEMTLVKHPFREQGIRAQPGIEF